MTERKFTDEEVISEKLESLHKKILKSKFAETVYESEIMALIVAVQTINRQKSEIDILVRKHDTLLDEIAEKNAEIERLNAVSEICGDCHKKYAEKIERAKAEAIKEFWNELKCRNTLDYRIVSTITGDNLVKEMTEDQND